VYDLFERVNTWTGQDTVKCGSKYRRPTVSSQFKVRNYNSHNAFRTGKQKIHLNVSECKDAVFVIMFIVCF